MKALEDALQKLPKHLANFIRMQIKLHSRKKHGGRYSSEMKSIGICLFHARGKEYWLLSKLFILPNKSSIHRYISKLPSSIGISQAVLRILETKVKQMSPRDKLCTLCMNEVSLKTHLFYIMKKDQIMVWRTSVYTELTKWQPQHLYSLFEGFLGIGSSPLDTIW